MKELRSAKRFRGTQCINCEHPLDVSDCYCSNCGQINSTKKLSFDDFFNEFFAGWFAYDSRIRRTIVGLLFHPGKISKNYIRGKRVRYANPFRFYLSASIIFFIIWNLTNTFEGLGSEVDLETREISDLTDEEIKTMTKDIGQIPNIEKSNLKIDSLLINTRAKAQKTYLDEYFPQKKIDSMGWLSSFSPQVSLYNKFHKETKIQNSVVAIDSLNHSPTTYNKWLYKKVVDFNAVSSDPSIFIGYFINKLPFIIFFYLPVFALFIWLLYLRRPFNYMEHLIFVFHIQTTFFVFLIIPALLDFFFETDTFTGIVMFIFLFYLYKAMRNFYGQGRFKTVVKFIILNVLFLILAVIAATLSFLVSFAIF